MNLFKKEHCYIIKGLFPAQVTAGFTSSSIDGRSPQKILDILSFIPSKLKLSYLTQPHSSKVWFVHNPGLYQADALFTDKQKLVLLVKTADCLPLLFCNEHSGIIGMVHMGWRSAKEGILDNINMDMSKFKVAAGPSLRCCCYQVGEEFSAFARLAKHIKKCGSRLYFDPIEFAKDRLFRYGLKEDNFFDSRICSFCSGRDVFSWRKDKTDSRTLNFIVQ